MPDETDKIIHDSGNIALKHRANLERRTKALGQKDEAATTIFRSYHLPGQNQRSLLGPEEYVIRVRNPHRLVDRIKVEQADLNRNWEKTGITEKSPLISRYQVILGDPHFPEQCYRHTLLNAQASPKKTVILTLRDNIEHDKGGVVGTLIEGKLLQGKRTGQLTKHQRAPIGVTTFPDDTLTIEIDPTEQNLWIVVVSAAAINPHMKKSV